MLLAFVLRIYECQMFYYAETVFTLSEFSEIYCIIMTMSKCFSRFRPRQTNVSFMRISNTTGALSFNVNLSGVCSVLGAELEGCASILNDKRC